METPVTAPLNWEETSFLDNIIGQQTQVSIPSSVTTIPPFDSLNPTAPAFVPARPQTPRPSPEPRQPFTELSMNNPQDLSLVTRRARRRQRAQNATARRPDIPPPSSTQQRAPQTARRGRPRRQAPRPQRPDPFEGFYDAAGEHVDGYHGLVHSVLLAPDFDVTHLQGFRSSREAERLDKFVDETNSVFTASDGWIQTTLELPLPCEKIKHQSETAAPKFNIEGVYHRRVIDIIKSAVRQTAAEHFHIAPFTAYWKPSDDSPPERVFSELYTADAFIEEQRKIDALPQLPEEEHEKVIIGLMLWSDSTRLANFGNASLWPVYLYIANQSKYMRVKPKSFSAHHVAYIPKLNDNFDDFYREIYGMPPSTEVLKHCRREIIQLIMFLLLDDEFMQMYEHGLILEFVDGIKRRVFPRFFTHSADYPEKALLSCIKFLGKCPCPMCLIEKKNISRIGTEQDRRQRVSLARNDDILHQERVENVRQTVFEQGLPLSSTYIEQTLGAESLTATRSAYSTKLLSHGLNFYSLFVPDLMHEVELGVWKALFKHLLRILHAYGNDTIQKLNSRYRAMPTFGNDTIRKFRQNVSGAKQLAARDYEDLLQCAIPAFDGLLPPGHNKIICELLFELATWHALAKLRLHTETTLRLLRGSTKRLGKDLRLFRSKVCPAYDTRELPAEETARRRRQAARPANTTATTTSASATGKTHAKHQIFNMETYKLHALGHYEDCIRRFGTSDNYNTQTGELEHCRVKRFYPHTSKAKYTQGISKQERRERTLFQMSERLRIANENQTEDAQAGEDDRPQATQQATTLKNRIISQMKRNSNCIYDWLARESENPGLKNFILRLKTHILVRLRNLQYNGDEYQFTDDELNDIIILDDTLYRHKVLRINYTTYDLRRDQDSVNPRNHADIKVLADEEGSTSMHPYWYARVLGVFHVNIYLKSDASRKHQRVDFLWVHWFGRILDQPGGWKARCFHRVGFVNAQDEAAFGFVDPANVIRSVYLIPDFDGHSDNENSSGDWTQFYVNIFPDRDMVMRFRGGGIGHKTIREAVNVFLQDKHPIDIAIDEKVAEDERETMDMDNDEDETGEDEEIDQEEDEENERDPELEEDGDEEMSDNGDALGPEDGEDEAGDEERFNYGTL
ncbi:hypothetical protein M378DRAFT_13086 [Amanita muscaria Koide BX008]|uniref:Uncharacterized protein n=1 Tax=Amanita muscaria (strain Koide BX008) TaxID=946122 RepID=A0A0C2WKS6_AMAMK|nr:hypothetical protein M378DRAFT_13086 [Amanita muscaria Koide BX008]